MTETVNRERYPLAAEYLARLPAGFASHPRCEAWVESHVGARDTLRKQGDLGVLPREITDFLESRYTGWFPEVIGQTAEMMVADCIGEAGYISWCYDDAAQLFRGPLIRHLMRLVSPTLVVMGATNRWGSVHRGTTLRSLPVKRVGERTVATVILEVPEHHYPPLFLEGLAESFRAAIDGARGSQGASKIQRASTTSGEYEVSWAR